jgi:hypothetical protein
MKKREFWPKEWINMDQIPTIKLLERVTLNCLGVDFKIRVEWDKKYPLRSLEVKLEHNIINKYPPRMFLQIQYTSPCTKTGKVEEWSGRKWYLSEHMTNDEVIKTAYAAFETAIRHEIMEGFKVDGKILFNPHVDFEELLKVSGKEVKRE